MRVLRVLMRLSSGHMTLLRREFQPPKLPPNRTYGAGRPRVGLCPKFLVLSYKVQQTEKKWPRFLAAWRVVYRPYAGYMVVCCAVLGSLMAGESCG